MARRTKRCPITLDAKAMGVLGPLARSRTAQARESERARVLLEYASAGSISAAARVAGVTRTTAYKCIDKGLAMGWEAALKDTWHRPRDPSITPERFRQAVFEER